MPDGALYWYGNKVLGGTRATHGFNSSYKENDGTIIENTNNMYFSSASTGQSAYVVTDTTINLTDYSKSCMFGLITNADISSIFSTQRDTDYLANIRDLNTGNGINTTESFKKSDISATGDHYGYYGSWGGGRAGYVYAFWLE